MPSQKTAQAVSEILQKGYQLHPDVLTALDSLPSSLNPFEILLLCISRKSTDTVRNSSPIISVEDLKCVLPEDLEIREHDGMKVVIVAEKTGESRELVGDETVSSDFRKDVEVMMDPSANMSPAGMAGFQMLFQSRLTKLLKVLSERPDSSRLQKIADVKSGNKVQPQGETKIAGLVTNKVSRRNQIELTLEDETGQCQVLVVDETAKRLASEVLLDQVISIDVRLTTRGQLTAKSIYYPDIPEHIPSYSKKRVYAVLISDLHVGSKTFLAGPFERFVEWLSGHEKDESDEDYLDIVRRIGYVIIGGDCVDGVGVYPEQEYQLQESDIYKQYDIFANYLEKIPKRITLVIAPGNHDATRQALPQPIVSEKYAKKLHTLPNVVMVGDPAFLKLHGVKFLVYHGRSLDDVLAVTPGLSYSRPAAAMRILLRARHLAPMFGSRTPIAPEPADNLVIGEVPDVFHAGHVHTAESQVYKGTVIVNSGTWQAQTSYQQNMGIVPTPGIVPIIELSTLEVFAKNFLKGASSIE